MSERALAVKVYAALLHLYPRRFRLEYGDDMVALIEAQRRDEPAATVAGRALLDLAISVPNQHLEKIMHNQSPSLVPFTYLGLAMAGIAVAAIGGSEPTSLLIGGAVALTAGIIGAVAWHRSKPVTGPEGSWAAAWWKFLLSGPILAGAVILAAAAGVEAWFLGIAAILAALILTSVGLGLALAHVIGRHRGGLTT